MALMVNSAKLNCCNDFLFINIYLYGCQIAIRKKTHDILTQIAINGKSRECYNKMILSGGDKQSCGFTTVFDANWPILSQNIWLSDNVSCKLAYTVTEYLAF